MQALKRTIFIYGRNRRFSCDLYASTECINTDHGESLQIVDWEKLLVTEQCVRVLGSAFAWIQAKEFLAHVGRGLPTFRCGWASYGCLDPSTSSAISCLDMLYSIHLPSRLLFVMPSLSKMLRW